MSSTGQQTQRNANSAAPGRIQPPDSRGAVKAAGQSKMPPRKQWLWFVLVLLDNFLLVRLLRKGYLRDRAVDLLNFRHEPLRPMVRFPHFKTSCRSFNN
jgi:hypothetical protein